MSLGAAETTNLPYQFARSYTFLIEPDISESRKYVILALSPNIRPLHILTWKI